jgi:hypothetical protein
MRAKNATFADAQQICKIQSDQAKDIDLRRSWKLWVHKKGIPFKLQKILSHIRSVPYGLGATKNIVFADAQQAWMENFEFAKEEIDISGVSSLGGGKN